MYQRKLQIWKKYINEKLRKENNQIDYDDDSSVIGLYLTKTIFLFIVWDFLLLLFTSLDFANLFSNICAHRG